MAANPFDQFDAPSGERNPFDQFDAPPKPSSAIRRIADLGISAAKGAIGVPEAAVGIADLATGGRAGKLAEDVGFRPKDAKAMLDEYYSPQQKAANQAVHEAQGFLPTIGAALQNPSTIAQNVVESVPAMLAGGLIGRGIAGATKVAPWLAGAAGEGVVGAGSAAEQTRQQTNDGLLTAKQTIASLASGAATAALGAAGGKVAQKLGISDIDTVLAGGAAQGANKHVLRRIGEGAVAEGVLEELPQSMAEQALQNVAQDKPLGQGVPEAGAMGMLAGAVMGGGAAGALRGKPASTDSDVPLDAAADSQVSPLPPAGPLSAAATTVQGTGTALSGTRKIIADEATRQGLDPQLALMVSSMETGGKFNADAANPKSSARGLFQFMEATRKEYPEVTPEQWKDPQVQAQYGVAFVKKTNATMERLLGAPPTPAQAYMGHLLGAYGAASVLKADPNLPIEQVIAGYDPKRAGDIVRLNGMSGLTAGQAAEKWAAKAEQATGQLGHEVKAFPFADAKVAQKRADAQSASAGTPFEVVDHPSAPGRFAVLPVAAKEEKSTPAKNTDIARTDDAPLTTAELPTVDTANINPATGEIKPAFAQREADRPKVQDGDILNLEGQPFPSMFSAKAAAKEAGDGFQVIRLGKSEFVVRPQGEVNGLSPDIPTVPSGTSGGGLPEPRVGLETGLGVGAAAGPAVDAGGLRAQPARAAVSPADRGDAGAVAKTTLVAGGAEDLSATSVQHSPASTQISSPSRDIAQTAEGKNQAGLLPEIGNVRSGAGGGQPSPGNSQVGSLVNDTPENQNSQTTQAQPSAPAETPATQTPATAGTAAIQPPAAGIEAGASVLQTAGVAQPENAQTARVDAGKGQSDADKPASVSQNPDIDAQNAAAHAAATSPLNNLPEPTEAQKEAGNYRKGHITVQGLDISIENPKGSTRSGTGPTGPWSHTMSDHYGYIKRTVGADNEQVDVYVGPKPESTKVFVVDQLNQQTGKFDEHKAMLGYDNQMQAARAYRSNFDKGWKVGPVKAMTTDEFKAWLKAGDTKAPAAAISQPQEQPRADKAPEAVPREAQPEARAALPDAGQPAATPAVEAAVQGSPAEAVKPGLQKMQAAKSEKGGKAANTEAGKPDLNRETITPANDKSSGVNAQGESLYERKDGSVYRMHNGKPDFGGDLVRSVEAATAPAIVEESTPDSQYTRLKGLSVTVDVPLEGGKTAKVTHEAQRAMLDLDRRAAALDAVWEHCQ